MRTSVNFSIVFIYGSNSDKLRCQIDCIIEELKPLSISTFLVLSCVFVFVQEVELEIVIIIIIIVIYDFAIILLNCSF